MTEANDAKHSETDNANSFRREQAPAFESRRFETSGWTQKVLHPHHTDVVYPRLNNVHRIVAEVNSIFIDVLMPDYQDEAAVAYY